MTTSRPLAARIRSMSSLRQSAVAPILLAKRRSSSASPESSRFDAVAGCYHISTDDPRQTCRYLPDARSDQISKRAPVSVLYS